MFKRKANKSVNSGMPTLQELSMDKEFFTEPTDSEMATIDQILKAKTYFDVLEVSPMDDLDQEEGILRSSYLSKCMSLNPNQCSHPKMDEAFQRLCEAYDTLSDPAQRLEHKYEHYGGRPVVDPLERLFQGLFGHAAGEDPVAPNTGGGRDLTPLFGLGGLPGFGLPLGGRRVIIHRGNAGDNMGRTPMIMVPRPPAANNANRDLLGSMAVPRAPSAQERRAAAARRRRGSPVAAVPENAALDMLRAFSNLLDEEPNSNNNRHGERLARRVEDIDREARRRTLANIEDVAEEEGEEAEDDDVTGNLFRLNNSRNARGSRGSEGVGSLFDILFGQGRSSPFASLVDDDDDDHANTQPPPRLIVSRSPFGVLNVPQQRVRRVVRRGAENSNTGQVQQRSPNTHARMRYDEELQTLRQMGFTDDARNLQALQAAQGDVQRAIEFLV